MTLYEILWRFDDSNWRLGFQLEAVRVHVPIYVRAVPTGKVLDNTLPLRPRDENTRPSSRIARLIPGNNTGNNNADLPSFASTDPGIAVSYK